jgi:hypothetical protein
MADHHIKHDCAFYHINGCVSFHSYAPCMFAVFDTFSMPTADLLLLQNKKYIRSVVFRQGI